MSSQLISILEDLRDSWEMREDASTITFSQEKISGQECAEVIKQIDEFRSLSDRDDRNAVFKVTEDRDNFEYKATWEPDDEVRSSEESDEDTPADLLFSLDEVKNALDDLRNDKISDINSLETALTSFINNEHTGVSFVYRIDSDHISNIIKSELNEISSVGFYMNKSTFINHIDTDNLSSLRDVFVHTDANKQLFVIENLSGPCYSKSIGIFALSELQSGQFEKFIKIRSELNRTITNVGKECVIDRFEEIYIPPNVFEFRHVEDEPFISDILDKLSGIRLMYAIFSISDVVRKRNDSWEIRINGRKILEGRIELTKSASGWELETFRSDGKGEIELTKHQVESFNQVFEWAYEVRVTDRIAVLRNVATLYTTSITGLIYNIEDIHDSAKSNFKFYVEDSVDEFIGIQQEVSNYLIETHRQFSELQRNLANYLSRDLFRVFGFLLVTWSAIFLQIEELATVRTALGISLIPVVLYLILSLRSVHSLSQQFNSLENSREKHIEMYQKQMSKQLFDEIANSEDKERLSRQFHIDKNIYYVTFGLLLIASVVILIDLFVEGPVSDILTSLAESS